MNLELPPQVLDNLKILRDYAKTAWNHGYAAKTTIVITSYLALRYVLTKVYHKIRKYPPGPVGLPGIGSLPSFARHPSRFNEAMHYAYGSVSMFSLPNPLPPPHNNFLPPPNTQKLFPSFFVSMDLPPPSFFCLFLCVLSPESPRTGSGGVLYITLCFPRWVVYIARHRAVDVGQTLPLTIITVEALCPPKASNRGALNLHQLYMCTRTFRGRKNAKKRKIATFEKTKTQVFDGSPSYNSYFRP